MKKAIARALLLATLMGVAAAVAAGERLLATGGAQTIEGAGGGGLVPWALIAGYGTNREVGGSAYVTRVETGDFGLDSMGVALGLFDRVELSFARQRFDAGSVIPDLVLRMDVIGAKVRIFGDAVYDQDRWWPQVSLGAQHKRNTDFGIPSAVGAQRKQDTEVYAAATKLWLAGFYGHTVLGNLTLRSTRANQMGLLGFGGDRKNARRLLPEVSLAVMLNDHLALGAEYRRKPDNLSAFREGDFRDVFLAWFPHRNIALTAALANLGSIAGKPKQMGTYVSIQLTH
jgi:hypothetical protein